MLPLQPDLVTQPFNGLPHRDLKNLEPPLFRNKVAAKIEAPQKLSTRVVYKSKWAIFIKWCELNKVDFRSPSVNQIADFLLFLFNQTILLCYQLCDEETQNLHQVRAHDVRAFAAYKAFQGESPWTRSSQPAIGRPIILLHSSI